MFPLYYQCDRYVFRMEGGARIKTNYIRNPRLGLRALICGETALSVSRANNGSLLCEVDTFFAYDIIEKQYERNNPKYSNKSSPFLAFGASQVKCLFSLLLPNKV